MFGKVAMDEIAAAADRLGIETAALAAVAHIESGARSHAMVAGRAEPLIRFEGHYFDRRLSGTARELARSMGVASPQAGAVRNPVSQAARWTLLSSAAAIDRGAAYESTSWGIGQVMGAHWAWLGYSSVEALVAEARDGIAGQLRLMTRYIDKAGLSGALRRHDWAAFARGYNGPGFRRNAYDTKLGKAYARYAGSAGAANMALRQGMSGPAVAALQEMLIARGHRLAADGIFGSATAAAVRRFQARNGLVVDGIAGHATMAALRGVDAEARFRAWIGRALGRLLAPA